MRGMIGGVTVNEWGPFGFGGGACLVKYCFWIVRLWSSWAVFLLAVFFSFSEIKIESGGRGQELVWCGPHFSCSWSRGSETAKVWVDLYIHGIWVVKEDAAAKLGLNGHISAWELTNDYQISVHPTVGYGRCKRIPNLHKWGSNPKKLNLIHVDLDPSEP